jgi:hypothetical protein
MKQKRILLLWVMIFTMIFAVYRDLHVPASVVKAYQVADYWKKFRIVGDKK